MGHAPPAFDAQVAHPVVAVLTAVHRAVVAPPAAHVPAGHEPLPAAVVELARQYLPLVQGRHVAAPARLYVPAGHAPPVFAALHVAHPVVNV